MNKSNNQSMIDQQYLKAMNIDLWVARDAPASVGGAHSETTVPVTGTRPLAELSAAQLSTALSSLKLTADDLTKTAEVLVVTEDSTLSDDCLKLLGAMFKAIELDDTRWCHTGVAHPGTPLTEAGDSSSLKVVLLMLQTGGNANALTELRNVAHQAPGFKSPVIVTFHPQDLLDNPDAKRPAWEDLKQLRKRLH